MSSAFVGIDFQTQEGARLRPILEGRLQELRVRNDDQSMTERETAFIRGQISETKHLLAGAKTMMTLQSYHNREGRA